MVINKERNEMLLGKSYITVDTNTLMELLCCGRKTAVEIGCKANAKITMGKRVLWNLKLIQKYLDEISTT